MTSANSRRARLRAAMIRSLTSGRDSTYSQIQRIRRLIRMTTGESNSDDSDPNAFDSDGSHSSADDRRYFTAENIRRVSENDFGADEHTLKSFAMSDSLELPDSLVDKQVLTQKLNFNPELPKKWIKIISKNEIDYDTAGKCDSFLYSSSLGKINHEFGILGLLLYSSLKNLEAFDIEYEM
jgi:hypothetical protein